MSIADWPKLMRQTFEHTKPGGWAEFQDFDIQYYSEDGSLKKEHSMLQWNTTLLDASADLGREPNPGPKLPGWMKDAGFENVTHARFRLPVGPWPKDKHLVCSAPKYTDCRHVNVR